MKFKLLSVINRDYEEMLERTKEREYIRRVKNISKILEKIYDLKVKAIEHKVAAGENQEDVQKQSPRDVLQKWCTLKFQKVHRKIPVPEILF